MSCTKRYITTPQNIDKYIKNPFDIKQLIAEKRKKKPLTDDVAALLKNTPPSIPTEQPQQRLEIEASNI